VRHDRLDLEQCARSRERGHPDRRARRWRGHIQILVAHFAERADVRRDIDDVAVDLDHVLEARADRCQRVLDVLQGLHHLAAEILRHFAVDRKAELSRDVDDARRPRDLDHEGVTRRLCDRRRIDEARCH